MHLKSYIINRIILMIFCIFALATILFFLFRLLPGDPVSAMVSPDMSPKAQEELYKRFGLDRPLYEQYFIYIRNLIQGDIGVSFQYREPVVSVIHWHVFNTAMLIFPAIIIAYTVGSFFGAIMAWFRGSCFESVTSIMFLIFRSIPPFFLGMVVIAIFSFGLKWFPHSGMRTPGFSSDSFFKLYFNLDFLKHLALPMLVSILYFIARPSLIMRSTMLEIKGADFIELIRAKGVKESRIIFFHAARNSILPVITNLAIFLGVALGSSIPIEYVFGWPGLGRELVRATQLRDYPLAQGCFLMIGIMVMISNLIADITYQFLDPRVVIK